MTNDNVFPSQTPNSSIVPIEEQQHILCHFVGFMQFSIYSASQTTSSHNIDDTGSINVRVLSDFTEDVMDGARSR